MSGNANWSDPVLTSLYTSVLDMLKDRDVDAATLFLGGSATNIPTGAIRFNRGTGMFQEWDGATWNNVSLGGFGTMAAQNSNSVAITGGTITGVTAPASIINSGEIPLNRGGTGASLSLGASGSILQSNGAAVVFGTDGSALTGVIWNNINKTVSSLADLTTKSAAALTSGTIDNARLGTGAVGAGDKVLADNHTFVTPVTKSTYSAIGTTSNAGPNYLDNTTVTLGHNDTLEITATSGSATQNMNGFGIYNGTTNTVLAEQLTNSNGHYLKVKLRYQAGIGIVALSESLSIPSTVAQMGVNSNFDWTTPFSLSLWSGGVTGAVDWSWSYNVIKG